MMAAAQAAREESDPELLRRIAQGDLGGLGVLFDRYNADVLRYVGRLGVSNSDADDLVQQTFVDVVRAAASFDGRNSARSWLLGLATMVVRRHRSLLGRIAKRLIGWAREPRVEHVDSAAELFDQRQGAHHARRALERLSPDKRQVFVLIVLENASGEEAAQVLGVPVATVWTRLHRAKRDLRKLLDEEAGR